MALEFVVSIVGVTGSHPDNRNHKLQGPPLRTGKRPRRDKSNTITHIKPNKSIANCLLHKVPFRAPEKSRYEE